MKPLKNKRIDSRRMCSDLVEVSFQDQKGRWISEKGIMEDVSHKGLCVSLGVPVTPGRSVQLVADGFSGEAKVRYCHLGEYSFLLGLEFCDGYEWDPLNWRPKHLLWVPERDD